MITRRAARALRKRTKLLFAGFAPSLLELRQGCRGTGDVFSTSVIHGKRCGTDIEINSVEVGQS